MQAIQTASDFFIIIIIVIIVIIQEYEASSKIFSSALHFQEAVLLKGTVRGYDLHLP